MRALRVMHVIDSLGVGGAERMLVTLANRSSADGLKVSVCVTRAAGPLAEELDERIPLRVLPRRRRIDPDSFDALGRWAGDSRIRVFHVHGRSSFCFVAAAKTAGAVNAPIVLHDHFGAIERDRSVPAWMRCWGAALVEQYVGVCNQLSAWAEGAGVPRGRIRVIENGIETGRYRGHRKTEVANAHHGSSRTVTGIVAANLRPDKGIDVLLRALARVPNRQRPRILVCGSVQDAGYAGRCRMLAAALGLGDGVEFLGERNDIPRLAGVADFAVLPAVSESGPLVLAEFMAAGLPFVATDAGSLARRARDLGAGEFVSPGDELALAEALGRLVSLTPAERLARGEEGRILAERHFDIGAVMPRWYNVYEDTLGNGRR